MSQAPSYTAPPASYLDAADDLAAGRFLHSARLASPGSFVFSPVGGIFFEEF